MPRRKPIILPDGVTMEMLDEYARERLNEKRRAEYARDPGRVDQYRLSTYTNFMNRHGLLVIPMPPEQPWNELQQKCIEQSIRKALEQQGGVTNV